MLTNLKQPTTNGVAKVAPPKKRKSKLEDIYQKKTQLEHILLRPDTYIGSIEKLTESMWLYDTEHESMVYREITYVPGLYKIFDEILVNAADHKTRDANMDSIKIEVDQENNAVSICNNGSGIPVAMHSDEQMYVPTMIFGHLLTSSNYDDEEQKVTGGRNGFGAKLCNIFSSKFTVETCSKKYKKSFKQTWGSNMSKASEAKIKEFSGGSEFTKITFSPDLKKFKMDRLDDDIVAIMTRRAYDIAAGVKGVKVFLNGKRILVKNFKEYVDLFIKGKVDDAGNPVKCVYERLSEHWEVAIANSEKGFQHMSFVNSIATTKGGRHVDHVAEMITKKMSEAIKKKNKSGIDIKPFQIKNHMWVFINCQVYNPSFDSQTKENLTLQAKHFGTKCTLTDKFVTAITKCGIVESCLVWAKFKEQSKLQAKCSKQKQSKVKGVPKLEDANDAGTKHSLDCTLILTEGDSAKTLAVAGLGVIGRDRFGVFPLKGKLLNVREATSKQILENAEINNVIKIVGLQYNKKYLSKDDMKSLRYGKVMIMTDQDQDGSHIKGLIINFIHHNWPSLLKYDFLEEFITPIVKSSKGKESISFYSIPEFEEWKSNKSNWHTYKIKYYKGLGTSTSVEAKEYFNDMVRHKIEFYYDGPQDDHSINLAFSKKAVDDRKEWLGAWMTECKRRKELGLPEIYLYEKDTHKINYTDFVNKELVIFSNLDNERSIPSLVDGLKPGQRKVMFTCFKRNDKKEIKVAQLSGSVAEQSCYHHGEASLMSTIINLAHNFVGSNNINLLKPIGQFGTRLMGGKDAASPRYIFTQLSSLARYIFHPDDEPILNFLSDDNQKIEPEWYMPVVPMILINGSSGIGTGWSTNIPNFNPREVIANLRRMIQNEEPVKMIPWFKNFKGTIESIDYQKYVIHGEISRLGDDNYEISELPVRVWTTNYKESVLEPLTTGNEKTAPLLSNVRDHNTDTKIKMIVSVQPNAAHKVDEMGPHKLFKLQTTLTTSSMVLFDKNGVIKTYTDALEILVEFYELRLVYYIKRKDYILGMLEAEASKLSNQARFILEKCSGELTIENKKKKEMISEMVRKGYDSDPVKEWKKIANKGDVIENSSDSEEGPGADGTDFDYLLGMPMWNLTKEKKDDIVKKKEEKKKELDALKLKTPKDLWNDDLNQLLLELDKVEQHERDEEDATVKVKGKKTTGKRKNLPRYDFGFGERILPQIDAELMKKVEKAAQLKEGRNKKAKKEKVIEIDKFDDIANVGTSLSTRLGNSPDLVEKKANRVKKDKLEEAKSKKKPTIHSFDESDISLSGSDLEVDIVEVAPRERTEGRRKTAAKVNYNFSEDEVSSNDSDLSMHSNKGVEEDELIQQEITLNESSILQVSQNKPSSETTTPKAKPKETFINVSDTDSEFDADSPAKKSDQPSASEMFDSLVGSKPASAAPAKKQPPVKRPKKIAISDSDSDSPPMKKQTTKSIFSRNTTKSKPIAKSQKKIIESDDSDFIMNSDSEHDKVSAPVRETGRGKRAVKYTFQDSEDSDY